MSWAKRNLYFLISCILAVGLLVAASWFCYSSWQSNAANWGQLTQDYAQLETFSKNPGAGGDNNVQTVRDETKEVQDRVTAVRKFFTPVPGIPNTNHFEDRALASAVRETVARMRLAAQQHNVALPPDFAFSFTLQQGKAIYDSKSGEQLSKQLGEIRTICDTLYSCRIISLESVQREHTSDDVSGSSQSSPGSGADYLDTVSVTNGNIVVTPYQVTFKCFTPELGGVLTGFANQSHTIVVKTLNVQPDDLTMMADSGMRDASGNTMTPVNPRGGLPVVIDEKKLKVTMLLDFVKILPEQGR